MPLPREASRRSLPWPMGRATWCRARWWRWCHRRPFLKRRICCRRRLAGRRSTPTRHWSCGPLMGGLVRLMRLRCRVGWAPCWCFGTGIRRGWRDVALHSIELCAGVGMLGEGVRAAFAHLGVEHRTVCYVEREAPAASQLVTLMEAGALDPAPVWSDMLTFDGTAWRDCVDLVIAGFPCQDLSIAGRRAGLDGKRSGLFFRVLDIADACGAWGLVLENVAGIATATASVVDEAEGALEERAAARVLGELADRGWDAEWITLSAADVGASHGRARWFCFAWCMEHPLCARWAQTRAGSEVHPGCQSEPGGVDLDDAQCLKFSREPVHARPGGCRCRAADADGPGNELDHALSVGRRSRRPDDAGHDGQLADPAGGVMAHANGAGLRAIRRGEVHGNRETGAVAVARRDRRMADPGQQGFPDAKQPGKPGAPPALRWRAASELRGAPLFAPGPIDPRWPSIVTSRPDLAPAVEPGVRMLADGMAYLVDESRTHQLRQVGNGVVPLQAAAALVQLLRRAGQA